MNVKIVKRSIVIKNLILYIVFSLFYLHLLYSLTRGVSAINLVQFQTNVQSEWALIMLGLTAIIAVFLGIKVSRFIYFLFFSIILIKGATPLFKELDKFVLIMNFVYLVFAYYFHLFWKLELDEAFYKPRFTKRDLGPKAKLPVNVKVIDRNGALVSGELTNWDKSGCFISTEGQTVIRGKVAFEVEYENRIFTQDGIVMTEYDKGVGIKFQKKSLKTSDHDWLDFYDILRDRGLLY